MFCNSMSILDAYLFNDYMNMQVHSIMIRCYTDDIHHDYDGLYVALKTGQNM